jgi:hypothetical protein
VIRPLESSQFWLRKLLVPVDKLLVPVDKLVIPVEKLVLLARNVSSSFAPRFTRHAPRFTLHSFTEVLPSFARLLRSCMNARRKKAHLTKPLVPRNPLTSRHNVRRCRRDVRTVPMTGKHCDRYGLRSCAGLTFLTLSLALVSSGAVPAAVSEKLREYKVPGWHLAVTERL